MLPSPQRLLQAPDYCLPRWRLPQWRAHSAALGLMALALPIPAFAQSTSPSEAAATAVDEATNSTAPIAFEANQIEYDSDNKVVTASGDVILRRDGQSVRADTVSWNRETGQIVASGNIRLVDADGNQLFTDRVELTDELKVGAMENILLAFREGARIAAIRGERNETGAVTLERVAYSACEIADAKGCPKSPSWRITARRVVYDEDAKQIHFYGAYLELLGVRLLPLPKVSLSTDGSSTSGFLIPEIRVSASNGVELSETYYHRLDNNRDLSLTGYVYTKSLPMISAQYRALTSAGAYQITGYATGSERVSGSGANQVTQDAFRGYLSANGRFQLSPNWSVTASGRIASDRTFLRRYDISRDDRLRSTANIERIDNDSYLTIAGWATQTLRTNADQGNVPIALPAIDYRHRLTEGLLGGTIQLQANSLGILRTDGQDTQRAFASAQWNLRRLTSFGQEITLTGLLRGDVYHSDENDQTLTQIYRGNPGWEARGIATGAIDVKWPLAGELFGGTQILTPRVQLVATPSVKNLEVPNEDSRAIDLEDSNLFSLNRFPGYDRYEDGVRFTYGFDWQLFLPGWQISSTLGQSYRLTSEPTLLPDGTGLTDQLSDVVGRTEVRFRNFVKFTHRFRLDKDSFAFRRNEIDATLGSERTYAEVGYLRLNRDITEVEDLVDREEVRVAGRVGFARYWSIFGSGVVNLTDANEDVLSEADGFEPVRTRLGIAYQDDCLELAFTWRHDYVQTGDAESGNTFQFRFALRNLGF